MAKVLKNKKGSNVLLRLNNGAEYSFFTGNAGEQLIINDKHADELLDKYSEVVSLVDEKNWCEVHKDKYKEYVKSIKEEALEKYPDLFQEDTEVSEVKKKKKKGDE